MPRNYSRTAKDNILLFFIYLFFNFVVFGKTDSQLTLCRESLMDHEASGTILLSGPGPKQVKADIMCLFSQVNLKK